MFGVAQLKMYKKFYIRWIMSGGGQGWKLLVYKIPCNQSENARFHDANVVITCMSCCHVYLRLFTDVVFAL